jgi:capsular polysaccharide biosynthesis protein
MSGKGSKEEAIAVLQSELITENYVREANLLPVLYAKRWDPAAKHWKADDRGAVPTLWMANLYFKKHVRDVKEDKQTGLVTMRITWTDPVAAAKWANDLVRVTNQYMRDKAIQESQKNIDYLTDQAAKTSVVEARSAIFSIMKDEVNKQMIARGRDEYALKVLDPAQPPEIPSSPSAMLLGAAGAGLGLVLSALLVWRRSSRR